MKIKFGKFETSIPVIGALLIALIVDNIHANHCRKKVIEAMYKDDEKAESKGKESV